MPFQFDEEMELIAATDKAVLVREAGIAADDAENGVNQFWIPKNVIVGTDLYEIGDVGTLEVKSWWASQQNLTDEDGEDDYGCGGDSW